MPKKKAITPAWDHFGQRVDGEGRVIDSDVAVCHQCHSNVRASGGNASNLLSHLRIHHPTQYMQVLQLQKAKAKKNDKRTRACSSAQAQSSIPELFTKAQKYERTS